MTLLALIDNLPVKLDPRSPRHSRNAIAAVDIAGVTEDSRAVIPGALFIARKGMKHDGRQFIHDAVRRGAAAVLSDGSVPAPTEAVSLVAQDVPAAGAQIVERYLGCPSRALTLIGVTGTNGKTTIAHLIHQLLNTHRHCGLISTVETDDGAQHAQSTLTTPPATTLSRLIRRMVDNGCNSCVMEASSHALQQHRVTALAFDIAIFTNLTGDHMDYHGSMDAYRAMKARLFEMLPSAGLAIVNANDPSAEAMLAHCDAEVWRCSMDGPRRERATCSVMVHDATITGMEVTLRGPWGEIVGMLPLCGKHNAMNALQSMAAAYRLGIGRDALQEAMRSFAAPPGRLEPVTRPNDPFAVYVDYAHTDDALENVLRAMRPLVPDGGRLRVVFGCGGDRDPSKRPRMARVCCRHADQIIITSDNPRTEDPQQIMDDIAAGVPRSRSGDVLRLVDRREAIRTAVQQAGPGDIVLIAGKGHEDYQEVGEIRRPFDDCAEARQALAARREHEQTSGKVAMP